MKIYALSPYNTQISNIQRKNIQPRSNQLNFTSSAELISNINQGLLRVASKNDKYITIEEIKKLISSFTLDKAKLTKKYGKCFANDLILSFQRNNQEYFIGENPNDTEDYQQYRNCFKIYSQEEKYKLITDFANINNGAYLDFWKKNPEKLLMYVNENAFLPSQIKYFNKETLEAILKSHTSIFQDKDRIKAIDAINKYTTDYYNRKVNFAQEIRNIMAETIEKLEQNKISLGDTQKNLTRVYDLIQNLKMSFYNDDTNHLQLDATFNSQLQALTEPEIEHYSHDFILTTLKNLKQVMDKNYEEEKIDEIIKYLCKVSITSTDKEKQIPIWRDDNFTFFNNIELNGEKLSTLAQEGCHGNKTKLKQVLKYFNTQKPLIERNCFLSTSIKPYEFMNKPIKWNFQMGEGLKYLYISDIARNYLEAELLIHPCNIKIQSASFDGKKIVIDALLVPKAD